MYRKSLLIIFLSILIMGFLSVGTRFIVGAISGSTLKLPSYYDPGISLTDAVKSSKKPLLIEFYTDQCNTCQTVTPWIHKLADKHKKEVTFLMIDIAGQKNEQIANMFGISYVPTLFVFDHSKMTRLEVSPRGYSSFNNLSQELEYTIQRIKKK